MPDLQGLIKASFDLQGLMVTLGASLAHVEPGEVRIDLPASPSISQQNGYTHAGAITSIVDTACGYAALTVAPQDHGVLTVEFKVNFLRPAMAERYIAIGRVVSSGRTLTVCSGKAIGVSSGQEKVVALMQATIMNV